VGRADARAIAPRAIVVSDVRLYREGLALALSARGEVEVAGTAADFDGAFVLVTHATATVVLLDAGMPHALDFARQLLQAEPTTRVVGVAVNENGADVVACAEAGLVGYVPLEGSIDDTISAIVDATHNVLRCSPRIAAALFKHLSHPVTPPAAATLTRRELEVAHLLEHGLSNKAIGAQLSISSATVKNHVHKLLEKLNVGRRGDAAAQLRELRVTQRSVAVRRSASPNTVPLR
jgi:two-component system nitrate/nitrite response regulator NarL